MALLLAQQAQASLRYDPRLRFRTLSTPRFDIHFHQGEERLARRLALIAEDVAATLDRTLGPPDGRVHVILVNQTDLPNGWATPVPNNVIEITAAAPGGESQIGNTDDWLRIVFTHEYTHVVHLSRARGWIGGLRRVFGRMPLLFPNLFTPLWQIEGLATYQESALTGQGRMQAGDFRMIPDWSAHASRFLALDQAGGGLVDWPSGHAPYAYGGLFHDFLARTYGPDALRKLTDTTAGRPPYFGPTAFRSVFDRSLGDLWQAFEKEREQAASFAKPSANVRRLTTHGFNVAGARYAPDGTLFYSVANPHGFPALMSRSTDGHATTVTSRYLGSRIGFAGDEIVFDQHEIVAQVGLQSDLYAVHRATGAVRRLTRHARASDPDVAADGRTIVCTVQRDEDRVLATLVIPDRGNGGEPVVLLDDPKSNWAAPRWSPDGTTIVAERRTVGGPSELVLVDVDSRRMRTLVSSAAGRTIAPAWTADGRRVLFAYGAESPFELRAVDIASGEMVRLPGTGPAHTPAPSPDGGSLAFVGYTADGFDLFAVNLTDATWARAAADAPVAPTPERTAPAGEDRAYSPWSTLLPRFWVPTFESDADEFVVGAATGGYDALGRHAYGIEGGWSLERARPDWQIAYAYDRWWPTIFVDYSDDTDPWRDGDIRTREVNAGMLLPFRRVRWTQSVLASLHGSTDELTCTGCTNAGAMRIDRRGVRGGWLIDAARAFGYSISEEEGWSASSTIELVPEALGSDGNTGSAIVDVRGYLRLGPRHAVLAVRGAGASSWGDERVRRLFSASGSDAQGRGFAFSSDAIGLMRGTDEGDVLGEQAAVLNVDYRFPLWRIERGLGTLPAFFRTVHAAAFVDVGHAWSDRFDVGDVSRAAGLELSLDTVIGYNLPLTFSGGVSWYSIPQQSSGVTVFGRVGRAF
jgi:Tol biopolymer transport system component